MSPINLINLLKHSFLATHEMIYIYIYNIFFVGYKVEFPWGELVLEKEINKPTKITCTGEFLDDIPKAEAQNG